MRGRNYQNNNYQNNNLKQNNIAKNNIAAATKQKIYNIYCGRACVGSVCGGTFCEERSFCPFTPILENFIPPGHNNSTFNHLL